MSLLVLPILMCGKWQRRCVDNAEARRNKWQVDDPEYKILCSSLTSSSQELGYTSCTETLKSTSCLVRYPITIPDISVLTVDGQAAIMPIACA